MNQNAPKILDQELILKVAKNLQSSYFKQTSGEPRKWRDVPADERKLWIRLARTACRLIVEGDQPQPMPQN
jgi:hypothetical protein